MQSYYISALNSGKATSYKWALSIFATLEQYTMVDDYDIGIVDGEYVYKLGDEVIKLSKKFTNESLLSQKDKLIVKKNQMDNVTEDVETTYGRAYVNQLLLCHPFGNRIPYINKQFTIRELEKKYAPMLVDDDKGDKNNITVKQHIVCKRGCELIGQLTRVLVHSATAKNITPPTNIVEYKKKLLAEFKKQGKDINDPLVVVEWEKKLIEFDEKYLEGDPSLGVYMSGKVKDKSRLKVYMSYGTEKGWSASVVNPTIHRSLSEGAAKTPEELVTLNNTVRTASYSRGTEIIRGGVTATLLGRVTAHLTMSMVDCKTKRTIDVRIRKGESGKYLGRYIVSNGKTTLLTNENISTIDDSVIKLRDIMVCDNKVFCKICSGDIMSNRNEALGLFAFGVSSKIISASLRSFHGEKLTTCELDINDIG